MRVFLSNLGCKLNQAELERAARQFVAAGHVVVDSLAAADLHVVNTCTVTHVAARSSRKLARRGSRRNPSLRTVLTGCWVAEDPGRAAALEGVDLVVGNQDKDQLVERVHERFPECRPTEGDVELPYHQLPGNNARAAVKIEDGCNVRCAFCIIPSTRGRQRSRPPEEILGEVRGLVGGGFEEIVLTGVQISHYRFQGLDLHGLVERILAETELPRLRLTSVAPWRFDPRILDLFATGRLCRHFHLSLQSGCSRTLTRMRRPYSAASYRELVLSIRAAVPGIALTTDVIAGFPGESDADFEESLSFVDETGFAKVHAFPFSPRPGTPAAELPDPVSPPTIRARMEQLLAVADRSERRFWRDQIGEELDVLWERSMAGEGERVWTGTTDNYIHVRAEGSPAGVPAAVLLGRRWPARLEGVHDGVVHASWGRREAAGR